MNNKGQLNSKELQIQGLLDQHLQSKSINKGFESDADHLDQDSLTAFVEGNLNADESKPMISHLAGCSYCRHISAELIKLDLHFAEEPAPAIQLDKEPTKVSEVLSGVLSKIFGANEGAVFAHNENEEDTEKKIEDTEIDK